MEKQDDQETSESSLLPPSVTTESTSSESSSLSSSPRFSKERRTPLRGSGRLVLKGNKAISRATARNPRASAVPDRTKRIVVKKREDMLANEFSNLSLEAKESKPNITGLSYDERMVEHRCLWDSNYPECPERFLHPLQRCRDYGLVDRCQFVPCRPATENELLTQHSKEIIDLIQGTQDSCDEDALEKLSSKYDAIYFHPSTYELALLSAGSTIDLVDQVVIGKLKNAMGLIRPPGHHAMQNEPCGYCFFNNVAVAAKHAIDNLGLQRVLIVDWDVHHGQASQYMFYNDPRVLYFSVHRYEHGEFWPNLRESNFDHIGDGPGKGFNFNVPLNRIGMGNSEYLAIFHQLLLPVAYEFAPELVIVSSGYDAAIGCFEGCMEVTPACYTHLLSSLMGLAHGKVCVILEGGYCLKSLSEGVALTLRCLLGDPCPTLLERTIEPCQELVDAVLNVIYFQRPYWKCLQFQGSYALEKSLDTDDCSNELFCAVRHEVEILYLSSGVKQTEYATRDCYPVQSAEEIEELNRRIDVLIANTRLTVPPQRTGLVYDERMLLHKNAVEPHPERPDRLLCIMNKLEEYGVTDRCYTVQPRMATEDELMLLHTKNHVQEMKATTWKKPRDLNKMQDQFQSIYLCHGSYQSALLAAGCLFEILDEVLLGKVQNGVAVVRPPGHHAESSEPCGFCIFNNVALAAMVAVCKHNLTRVLIVDWDVHHGNGTQHMFDDDPRILYISVHRYDKGTFFPCSEDANFDRVGKGLGTGFNVNIPWNKGGMGDGDYLAAMTQVILPIAYEFNPELVLVSAGFDAARGDPLGGCRVTPEGFSQMTHFLCSLANGRVILALEGGYNLLAISQSMAYCTKVLLGDPCPTLSTGLHPSGSAVSSISNVIKIQKKYWKALKFQVDLPSKRGKVKNVSILQNSTSTTTTSLLSDVSDVLDDSVVSSFADMMITMDKEKEAKPDNENIDLTATCSATSDIVDVVDKPQLLYAVQPIPWCPHLETVRPLPEKGINVTAECQQCGDKRENWLCLTCYEVYCGRVVHRDMMLHNTHTGHCVVLGYRDLSVWCYGCECYVTNEVLRPALDAAHMQKFGVPLPQPSSKEDM